MSTILAIVKFWEIWKNRIRVNVSYNFNTCDEIGNNVIIRNLSSTPFIIAHWELVWCRSRFSHRKPKFNISPNEFNEDIILSGHSSTNLNFQDMDHFEWSERSLGKNKIFLKLHIAGKLVPVIKKVYG